jgi:arginine:ornithine antiporter/lysine permease
LPDWQRVVLEHGEDLNMTSIDTSHAGPTTGSRVGPTVKLGAALLTALVIGSMVGSGVFSLPQNMAADAGPTAILIGWLITGVGMIALAFVFQSLATRKPELDSGPYAYAKAGFGEFIGFNSAWGYWLSAWIGNVSYAVILFAALSYFVPAFGEGNTWQAIVGASLVLWLVHFLILLGVREAAVVNAVTTIAKIAPIILFIGLVAAAFNYAVFSGAEPVAPAVPATQESAPALGSLFDQVRSTMLVTLWAFIGIEGASVVSARAAKRSDIGVATMSGLIICLLLYMGVSLLSLGILPQAELAALKNPSMAGVLEKVAGPWGAGLINTAVVISVLGAFLSWTLLAAEVPSVAAKDGTMPRVFGIENSKGSPAISLWVTNGLVQLFLIVTYFASATYNGLFVIASAAIMIPYVLSGAYALKLAWTGESYGGGESRTRDIAIGSVATLYGLWLVYAAGPKYLFLCAMLYAVGIVIYLWARSEAGARLFKGIEAVLALALAAAGIAAGYLLWTGQLTI